MNSHHQRRPWYRDAATCKLVARGAFYLTPITGIMDLLQDLFASSDELQPALFCGDVQEELPSLGRSRCNPVSHSDLINAWKGE